MTLKLMGLQFTTTGQIFKYSDKSLIRYFGLNCLVKLHQLNRSRWKLNPNKSVFGQLAYQIWTPKVQSSVTVLLMAKFGHESCFIRSNRNANCTAHTHTLSISILLLFEIRWIKPGVRQWGKASTFEASSLFRWFWLQPLMVESNDDYDNGYANHWQWKSLENVNWSENVFFIRLSNFVETFTEMEFANVWMAEAQEEQIDHLPLPSSLSLSRARSQPMSLSF